MCELCFVVVLWGVCLVVELMNGLVGCEWIFFRIFDLMVELLDLMGVYEVDFVFDVCY